MPPFYSKKYCIAAIKSLNEGMTIVEAAKSHGIPAYALWCCLKRQKKLPSQPTPKVEEVPELVEQDPELIKEDPELVEEEPKREEALIRSNAPTSSEDQIRILDEKIKHYKCLISAIAGINVDLLRLFLNVVNNEHVTKELNKLTNLIQEIQFEFETYHEAENSLKDLEDNLLQLHEEKEDSVIDMGGHTMEITGATKTSDYPNFQQDFTVEKLDLHDVQIDVVEEDLKDLMNNKKEISSPNKQSNKSGYYMKMESLINNMCICDHCGDVFQSKELLHAHVKDCVAERGSNKRTIQEGPFLCERCGDKEFKSIFLHDCHMRQHRYEDFKLNKSLVCICERCGREFPSKRSLRAHMFHHEFDDSNQLKCRICGKRCHHKGSLSVHMHIHNVGDIDKSPCTQCGKMVRTHYLPRHMVMHQIRYTCDLCNKHFTLMSNLEKHKRMHTEVLT